MNKEIENREAGKWGFQCQVVVDWYRYRKVTTSECFVGARLLSETPRQGNLWRHRAAQQRKRHLAPDRSRIMCPDDDGEPTVYSGKMLIPKLHLCM